MSRCNRAALAASLLIASATAAHAAPRAFVASTGNDANTASSCAPTTPCRSFTAAHSVVDPGGEIVALDAAGYGAVTITKSVTIAANPGAFAGIAASSGSAVTIATAGVHVVLRGLNINGAGGLRGINMTNGASLTVENCVVSNFSEYGIFVSGLASVRIVDTTVRANGLPTVLDGILLANGVQGTLQNVRMTRNGRGGVTAQSGASGTTSVIVSNSDSSGNYHGAAGFSPDGNTVLLTINYSNLSANASGFGVFVVSGQAQVTIGNSTVSGNSVGLHNGAAGLLRSLGNNLVIENGSNTVGTITLIGGS